MRLEKDEILRKKSREVDIIDDKIQTLIDDMIETMYKYNGVGLSAVHVLYLARELLRVFVDEDQLVRDALYRQRVRGVRAHMAKADHTKNSFFAHIQPILSS